MIIDHTFPSLSSNHFTLLQPLHAPPATPHPPNHPTLPQPFHASTTIRPFQTHYTLLQQTHAPPSLPVPFFLPSPSSRCTPSHSSRCTTPLTSLVGRPRQEPEEEAQALAERQGHHGAQAHDAPARVLESGTEAGVGLGALLITSRRSASFAIEPCCSIILRRLVALSSFILMFLSSRLISPLPSTTVSCNFLPKDPDHRIPSEGD